MRVSFQNIKKQLQSKRIRWTLVVLWALVIFSMSHMNSVISWYLTGEVLTVIETGGVDSETTFEDKMASYEETDTAYQMYLLRKAAHVTEYFIFAVLLFLAFECSLSAKNAFLSTFLTGVLYAGFDEFHQLFISGRTGSIVDVGIDSVGLMLGLLSLYLFRKGMKRYAS